uniref:Uncharacterized protein n=1 Tax=Molossus molossus TaxID=27622 RepID=A0A7J8CZF2_MOLMO|nr:hypothetical protein HJG59_009485 [Molossus molossus]
MYYWVLLVMADRVKKIKESKGRQVVRSVKLELCLRSFQSPAGLNVHYKSTSVINPKVLSSPEESSFGKIFTCHTLSIALEQTIYLFIFIFFIVIRGHFSIFVQIEWEGGRGREKEGNIDVKETHRVAATRTTNQGRGQTATEVHALSGNRTQVSPDCRRTL